MEQPGSKHEKSPESASITTEVITASAAAARMDARLSSAPWRAASPMLSCCFIIFFSNLTSNSLLWSFDIRVEGAVCQCFDDALSPSLSAQQPVANT